MPAEARPEPHVRPERIARLISRPQIPRGVIAPPAPTGYVTIADVRRIVAASISDADITSAIGEAQSEVDSALQARYVVPFPAPIPGIITVITRDLAQYFATLTARHGDPIQPTDPTQLRYNHAETMLGQISSGKSLLDANTPGASEDTTGSDPEVCNMYPWNLFGMQTHRQRYALRYEDGLWMESGWWQNP